MEEKDYNKILSNTDLQAVLGIAFKRSVQTIKLWARERNDILTSIKAIKVQKDYEVIKDMVLHYLSN